MLKKIINISILIILILSSSLASGESLPLSGESYILIEENSARVLLENKAHKKMPIASTTKIMTALLAIEEANLEKMVKVSNDSINIEGSSIYLEEDEILSMEDLIYGLMLRSGNDAAIVIAKELAGDVDGFVSRMNLRAREIGALNTHFSDPHGLASENHYSTAYDLALITREALKHEKFRDIFSAKNHQANRDKNAYFINKNKTLWEYDGGNGGKTGYTMAAGRCLVSTAKRNSMGLIAVSLNARDWFQDNYKLFDFGFENFKPLLIYNKKQFINRLKIDNAKEELLVSTGDELIYPLLEGEKSKLKNKIIINQNLSAPINKGDRVGYIESYLDGLLVKRNELISLNGVNKLNILDRIINKIDM